MIELLFLLLQMDTAKHLAINNNHEKSEILLNSFKPLPHQRDTYNFYHALNNFRMNNKQKAEYYLDKLDNFEPNLPERYKVLATLMKEDLKAWQDKDKLDDVARDMQQSHDRLKNSQYNKKTQAIQKSILDRLDKMIDQKQDQLDKKKKQEDTSKAKHAQQPPEQPFIGDENGPGEVNILKMRKLAERWNNLPPRQQVEALQQLTQNMPARYRVSIENYFRSLSERKKR